MPEIVIAYASFAIVLAAAIFGFLKGDEPERIGAGAYALATFSTLLLQDEARLHEPQAALILIDAVMLVVYGALAWRSRRAWPAWAAAAQSVAVMAHGLMLANSGPSTLAFHEVVRLAGVAALSILCVGIVQAWRDRLAEAEETAR